MSTEAKMTQRGGVPAPVGRTRPDAVLIPLTPSTGHPPQERLQAAQAGVRVEQVTVAWMAIEALVAIGVGILAHSVLLVAFGLDSVIELVSGGVLLWRLWIEAAGGRLDRVERAERRAARVVGMSLAALCVYIVVTAAWGLIAGVRPDRSPAGIGLAVAALVVMPLLVRAKRRIAAEINSAALHGDAACSLSCVAMAAALLGGLGFNAVLHWWQAEYVAALAFLYWLVPETRRALRAAARDERACCCDVACGR